MTALRRIQHRLTLAVGATLLAIGLTLLTLFGLAAVALPAALAILAMELTRVARWMRRVRAFCLGKNPPLKQPSL